MRETPIFLLAERLDGGEAETKSGQLKIWRAAELPRDQAVICAADAYERIRALEALEESTAECLRETFERAEAAEARLKEAKSELSDWIENRGPRLAIQLVNEQVTEANEARKTLSLALEQAIAQRDEADARAEAAEKKLSDIQHSFHRAKQVRETYRQEMLRAQAALKQVEWVRAEWATCPWCDSDPNDGHKPDCARQAALRPDESEGKE